MKYMLFLRVPRKLAYIDLEETNIIETPTNLFKANLTRKFQKLFPILFLTKNHRSIVGRLLNFLDALSLGLMFI